MSSWLTIVRQVSLRRMRSRRLRTGLTVLGIAVGVALVFAVRIVNGTLVDSAESSARQLAGTAQLEVFAADQGGIAERLVGTVDRVDGVRAAIPVLHVKTEMTGPGGESARTQVFGVTPAVADLLPPSARGELAAERLRSSPGEAPPVLLSGKLGRRVGAGDRGAVTVQTPSGPRVLDVVGRIGGGVLDEVNGGELGATSLAAAQRLFARPGRVDSIYVLADAAVAAGELEDRLDGALDGAALVGRPRQRTEAFEKGFEALTSLVSLGAGVGLFIAVFLVFNTLAVAVTERRRELATALMLGASPRQLVTALAFEAVLLGLVGSALGVGLGLLIANGLVEGTVESYEFIFPDTNVGSVVVAPGDVAFALIGGLVVSLAGAVAPLRRIAALAPIESLRPHAPTDAAPGRRRGARRPAAAAALVLAGLTGLAVEGPDWLASASLAAILAGVTVVLPVAVPWALERSTRVLERAFGVVGRIAGDALARHPRRTTFTVAALLLPAALAIGMGGAVTSYTEQAERDAYDWHGTELKVSPESFTIFGADQPLPPDLGPALERIDGVARAYPERRLLVDVDGELTSLYAAPVAASLDRHPDAWISPIRASDTALVEGLADGDVVVSEQSAQRQGIEPGDTVSLPTPTGERAFTVAGAFDELAPFDSLFVEYDHFRRIWGDSTVDELSVVLEPGADRATVASEIRRAVDARGLAVDVLTRDEKVDQVLETVEALSSLVGAIQFAALFIAALAIANTLFTSVYDRGWEIALQRLVGLRRRELGKSVLLEAATVGALGSLGAVLVGLPLGYALVRLLESNFSWSIAFEAPLAIAAVTVVAGFIAALLAGLYPRRAAVRAPLAQALRNE